jgi:hypothetical protein
VYVNRGTALNLFDETKVFFSADSHGHFKIPRADFGRMSRADLQLHIQNNFFGAPIGLAVVESIGLGG